MRLTLRPGGESQLTLTAVFLPQINTASVVDSSPRGTGVGVLVGQGVGVGMGLGVGTCVGAGTGVWGGVGTSGTTVAVGMASIVAWTLASTVASTSGAGVGVAVGIALAMAACTVASTLGVGSGAGGWAQAAKKSSDATRAKVCKASLRFTVVPPVSHRHGCSVSKGPSFAGVARAWDWRRDGSCRQESCFRRNRPCRLRPVHQWIEMAPLSPPRTDDGGLGLDSGSGAGNDGLGRGYSRTNDGWLCAW